MAAKRAGNVYSDTEASAYTFRRSTNSPAVKPLDTQPQSIQFLSPSDPELQAIQKVSCGSSPLRDCERSDLTLLQAMVFGSNAT